MINHCKSALLLSVTVGFLLNACVVKGGIIVKRSDDANIQEVQTLVTQQASAISSLQASLSSVHSILSNFQDKIVALETRVATLSKTVAFTAMFSTDDMTNGISLSPGSTLKFDRVVSNAANAYDPQTGIFTAPIAGYYAFSIVMMEPNGANHPSSLGLAIVKQGAVIDEAWAENTPDYSDQGFTHAVFHVAAGEKVWIQQTYGDAVRGYHWTVFTGYLVHAD